MTNFAWATSLLCLTLLLGCQGEESRTSILPASSAVSSNSRVAKNVVTAFIKAVTTGDKSVEDLIDKKSILLKDKTSWRSEDYKPLGRAADVSFDSVGSALNGRRTVARIHFVGPNSEVYRTNFVLTSDPVTPKIVSISIPTYASKPRQSAGQHMVAPKL